ncbi:phosphotriesterase [Siminovitchia fortis]|uniref:Phosphotriesterase n=1 Tax=Siminovitchia fortis TaxID=254758 RepID=A0A451GBY2_9BACI|nr:phosphotriesterase [Siminovitchia fortis]RWR12624.1 phosphotriesterase [Siminovitchia fortis]WHY81429.1 phosphotriesterase [Siminovitchia fortis]
MGFVNTVTGKVNIEDLGCTLVHEHLLLRSEMVTFQFPHLYDEEALYQKAVDGVKAVKAQGVKTICDPTVAGMGRDVRFLERVSQETGMQIITATGIYSFTEIPAHFQNRDIDYMTEALIHDIEVGIQNTSIKAGFLKCAADAEGITPDLDKVFRAVARAQKNTGVPIMTHSHPASGNGLKQLEIFIEEGVNPKSIMIGHTGDTDNLDYIHQVLDSGAYIGADRFGQPPLEFAKRYSTLLELLRQGYANRIFLSQDYCCSIDWYTDEQVNQMVPDWSIEFLLGEVIPQLRKEGVTEEQIYTIMHENVKHWFEGK